MKRAAKKRTKTRRGLRPADYIGCAVRLKKKILNQGISYEAGTVMIVMDAAERGCTLSRQIDRADCMVGYPVEFTPLEHGVCHACQCTDDWGCDVGCEWVDETQTLCSACVAIAAAVTGLNLRSGLKGEGL